MQLQQTGGFLDAKRRNPVGLGLVIAGHVAVLGAVILNPPQFIRDGITHTVLVDYPEDKPPPPNPEVDRPMPKQETESRVDVPPKIVDTGQSETVFTTQQTIDPPHLPPLQEIVTPPAPPPPVIVEATLDERYRGRFQPDYPPSLARQEIEGAVTVRILVGADGRVKQVEQVSSADPAFFAATQRQALAQWRFRPATRDGVAVESWRTMTVRFRMA